MESLFLSYTRNDDQPFAHRLHSDLDRAGFDVGFDRLLPRGSCRDSLTMVGR